MEGNTDDAQNKENSLSQEGLKKVYGKPSCKKFKRKTELQKTFGNL